MTYVTTFIHVFKYKNTLEKDHRRRRRGEFFLLMCPSSVTFTYQIVPCPQSYGSAGVARPEMQLILRLLTEIKVELIRISIERTRVCVCIHLYILNKAVCKGIVMHSNVKSRQFIHFHSYSTTQSGDGLRCHLS